MTEVLVVIVSYAVGAGLGCWLLSRGYMNPLFDWLDRRFM